MRGGGDYQERGQTCFYGLISRKRFSSCFTAPFVLVLRMEARDRVLLLPFKMKSSSSPVCRYAAVPSHGEPALLPRPPDVPVRCLRSGVHRVRPDDVPLSPPLPAGQERLLQTDGHVWCQLAGGDGLQQVGATVKWSSLKRQLEGFPVPHRLFLLTKGLKI